jgi:hypothetical protein
MKTIKYERIEKPGTVKFCSMWIAEDPQISLEFDDGETVKLNQDFVADAIEHYLTYAISLGLKEFKRRKKCLSKKGPQKKQSAKTSRK